MELKMGTLDYRHVAISIGRKYIGPGFMRELKIDDAMEEEGTDVVGQDKTVFNLQSAHQGAAAMRYGVRGDIIHSLTEESLLVFGELSDKWHRFVGLHSRRLQVTKHLRGPSDGMQLVICPKKVRSSAASGSERGGVKMEFKSSLAPLTQMDVPAWVSSHTPSTGVLDVSTTLSYTEKEVTQALQKALGTEKFMYRSPEQERALHAVINDESPVIVVLPTGRGKSLTFMGPACLPQAGVTIVVAPFRTLEDNIISRCEEKGIECLKWAFGELRYLVKEDDYVHIEEGDDDDFFNEEIAEGALLRQEYFMGDDEAGKQLVKEARQIYYGENTFTVRSHWLCEFICDTLANGKPMAIEPLVRRIIVRVDVEHIYDMDNFTSMSEDEAEGGEAEKSWVVRDLRRLLKFTNAEMICIEKIEEMLGIVKKLIMQFGESFTIRKMMWRSDGQWTSHDMRSYWNKPTSMAKSKLPVGKAKFEELMQVQIEEWTREISPIVRLNDYWESLL
ncbi:hypothetical protein ACLOAV_008822 [Pseudogymnoascus australis]